MKRARLKVTLDKAGTTPVSVNYATQNGTAIAGTHFTAKSGTLTFAPGTLTQDLLIDVKEPLPNTAAKFTVALSAPTNALLLRSVGEVVLSEGGETTPVWLERFLWTHDILTNTTNGYFGPTTGPNAYMVPYHAKENAVIVEAPDFTRESVSETVSFWAKLETWNYLLTGNVAPLNKVWDSMERCWIPNATSQPWGDYTYDRPADYIPDAHQLTDTPLTADTSITVGADPLYQSLLSAYGTKNVYLMHWLLDVDGVYGFKNPDGSRVNVFINNFQRGPVEDGMATITHGCFDDFNNGGGPFGFQPIYNRELPVYPDSPSAYGYSKQMNFSMAGDADVRAVGNTFLALREVPAGVPAAMRTKASKMAAYIQYTLYDKYFQPIPGFAGDGCHYLLSWGMGFGVGMPEDGNDSYWGYRIGNSEIHHGYNGVDVAYAARTGAELAPIAAGTPARWAISLDRQLEMLRWLQSPEGAIAGGVTSNYMGRYETPTDGRQNATFYGCYYNHSPSWFNPFSNDWTGFQFWGMQRISEVAIHTAKRYSTEESIYTRCMVLLDKWIPWFYNNATIDLAGGVLEYPINSSWVSSTPIAGVTASKPSPRYRSLAGNPPSDTSNVYEYLPSLNWPGSNPDYANFWKGDGSVPNPNLKCTVTEFGWDPGTASGAAQILLQYCYAKKVRGGGTLTGNVPNTDIALNDVMQLAVDIMQFIWDHRDAEGFGSSEPMNKARLNDKLWIPPEFGSHTMPRGEVLANGVTTFKSMRQSFYSTSENWAAINAWLESDQSGEAPTMTYHRFWNGADVGVAFGMIHKYFPEAVSSS